MLHYKLKSTFYQLYELTRKQGIWHCSNCKRNKGIMQNELHSKSAVLNQKGQQVLQHKKRKEKWTQWLCCAKLFII